LLVDFFSARFHILGPNPPPPTLPVVELAGGQVLESEKENHPPPRGPPGKTKKTCRACRRSSGTVAGDKGLPRDKRGGGGGRRRFESNPPKRGKVRVEFPHGPTRGRHRRKKPKRGSGPPPKTGERPHRALGRGLVRGGRRGHVRKGQGLIMALQTGEIVAMSSQTKPRKAVYFVGGSRGPFVRNKSRVSYGYNLSPPKRGPLHRPRGAGTSKSGEYRNSGGERDPHGWVRPWATMPVPLPRVT